MVSNMSLTAFATAVIIFTMLLHIQLGGLRWKVRRPLLALEPKESGSPTKNFPSAFRPRRNIWAGVSQVEASDILTWIHDDSRGLNLKSVEEATPEDNSVWSIELLQPNKTDAISFLDLDKTPPRRFVKVTMRINSIEDLIYQDYLVGPLPISAATDIKPLSHVYTVVEVQHLPKLSGPTSISFRLG